jgi:hypothetical protein
MTVKTTVVFALPVNTKSLQGLILAKHVHQERFWAMTGLMKMLITQIQTVLYVQLENGPLQALQRVRRALLGNF